MDNNQILLEQVAPKHLLIFLGEKGLTQAEANHKANLVKEGLSPLNAEWLHTGAYNQTVDFEGKQVQTSMYQKINLVTQAQIEGNVNSLTAWLREGIKAKAQILESVARCSTVLLELEDDQIPSKTAPAAPTIPRVDLKVYKEEEIIGNWDIKTRAEYLSLEAQAAGIGKKIHGNGQIAYMREKLAAMKPNEFIELKNGKDNKVYVAQNTPVYTQDELENAFMELQNLHRAKESRLNYLKAQIQNDININNQTARQAHFEAQQQANTLYRVDLTEYQNAMTDLQTAHSEYQSILEKRRLALTNYVSKLRIVIPNDLQPILDGLETKK